MVRQAYLGFAALLFAASCTPAGPVSRAQQPAAPVTDPSTLLQKLALDVPNGALATGNPALSGPIDGAPLPNLGNAAPPFALAATSADDTARAVDCLAAAVYYEARSQSLDGQRAVAQVVLNRVRDRAFPNTVCGVVYQGHERRTGCQFTFTCDGSLLRPVRADAWDRSRAVAIAALSGSVYAPVGSATHYHADYVLPWWASSLTRVVQVGAHIFYRWRNAMEQALAFRQGYAGAEPVIPAYNPYVAQATTGGATLSPNVTQYTLDGGSVVSVHRPGAPAAAPIVAAAAAVSPTQPLAVSPRTMVISGVRVHRGFGDEGAASTSTADDSGVIVHRAAAPTSAATAAAVAAPAA